MKKVKLIGLYFLIANLIFLLCLKVCDAKTFAYLVGTDGSVTKIDTDTNSIISSSSLEKSSYVQSGDRSVIADQVNSNLFVVTGRLTPAIFVYDLKSLKFKKDMGITAGDPDVGILISPNGKQLFLSWFDYQEKGWFFDLYDAKMLSEIKNLGSFVWGPITTFSSDGTKIYMYHNKKIEVYETTNFTLLDTIDLNTVWKTDGFLSGIEDYKNEKILIRETKIVSQDSPPEISYFVYDLKSKTSSPRITTKVAGNTKLSPTGTRIFISDEESVWSTDKTYVMYHKSLGQLYAYDVTTGNKVGSVQFTVDRESSIIGIHPNGTMVYIKGNIAGVNSLIVMDIVNFKVVKTMEIPNTVLFMIFFEE